MKTTAPITDAIPRAILDSGRAWLQPAEIAAILGRPLAVIESACLRLAELGLVSFWKRPELVVTLTPATARRLGFALIEHGRSGDLSWVPAGDAALRRAPRSRARIAGEAATWIADPAGFDPEDLDPRGRPPRLLGINMSPWPGPGAWASGACPVCGSRPLPPRAYCLGCDRIGPSPGPRRPPSPGRVTRRKGTGNGHELQPRSD